MKSKKVQKILLGSVLVGGLVAGTAGCSKDKKDKDKEQAKTEIAKSAKEMNAELFEKSRSDIKFALAFVENYYPYTYFCGEAWTTGHGLTILYNPDGSYKKVTNRTKPVTLEESDVYKGRYLTFEVLPDIKKCVKVEMDENTMIAACVLRFCIGSSNFQKSSFVKELNAGKTGAELAKTLTGWRQQEGVINRCYFFAALMAGKIDYSDLLDLRAEGCYRLDWQDMLVYVNGQPKVDKNNFYEWDFSKVRENLKKAKQSRQVRLTLAGKKHVIVNCKMVKDIVPDYVLQNVSTQKTKRSFINYENITDLVQTNIDAVNDSSYLAYQQGNYKDALKFGKIALKYAATNKQRGAAYYNMGMAYFQMEKFGQAKDCFAKSVAENKTKAAQKQLELAQQKSKEKRGSKAGKFALGVMGVGALAYGGKKYLVRRRRNR